MNYLYEHANTPTKIKINVFVIKGHKMLHAQIEYEGWPTRLSPKTG